MIKGNANVIRLNLTARWAIKSIITSQHFVNQEQLEDKLIKKSVTISAKERNCDAIC